MVRHVDVRAMERSAFSVPLLHHHRGRSYLCGTARRRYRLAPSSLFWPRELIGHPGGCALTCQLEVRPHPYPRELLSEFIVGAQFRIWLVFVRNDIQVNTQRTAI